MSIRQIYDGGGYAAYPGTVNFKGNLTAAEPVSGATGGIFSIGFADLPATPDNLVNALWGHDPTNVNNANPSTQVTLVQVGGPSAGTPDRLRTVSAAASSGATVWGGTETTTWTTQTRIVRRAMGERTRGPYLVVHGIINTGTDWRMFRGFCDGVTSEIQVSTQALTDASSYVTTATRWHSRLLGNCKRDYAVEHVAIIRGNFPHTGTIAGADLLPTASILQDLWDGTKTYAGADLTAANAALNAWMTGSIIDYRPLLNGDLTGMGSSTEAANPLVSTEVVASSGKFLNTNGGILVKNWASLVIYDPPNEWGWGGAGLRAPVVAGLLGSIPALEIRVTTWLGGSVVSGLDWQDWAPTTASGAFQGALPAALPVSSVGDGYRVWIRDKANPTVMASTGRRLRVGVIAMLHGQSQGEGTFYRGTSLVSPTTATQETYGLTLVSSTLVANQGAASGAAWSRPIPYLVTLNSGPDGDADRPALIAAMNQWYADQPDMPILYLNGCWSGLGMTEDWIPELDAWDAGTTPPKPTGASTGGNWFLYGNGLNLSGATNGDNSGLLTTMALLAGGEADFVSIDWATTDAPDYASFLASYARHEPKLRTFFPLTPNFEIVYSPGGRVGASGTVGPLRQIQHEVATTWPYHALGAVDGDSQCESDGNPHQLNGTADLGTGQRRRMTKIMRSAAKLYDQDLVSLGPVPSRFWIDPGNPKHAWVDIAWADRDLYIPDGDATDIPLCYVDDGSDTWAWHSDPTVSGSTQTMVADLIDGKIRLARSDNGDWATTGLYFNYARSIIFDSASGTRFKELDSYAGAQPPYKVGDMLNRIVYGRSDLEGGRGLMLRQSYGPDGLGLPLAAAPTTHKLVVGERLAPGTYSVTVEGEDSGGNIATQTVSLVIPVGDIPSVVPGAGWSGATAQPDAQGDPAAEGYSALTAMAWDTVPYDTINGDIYVTLIGGKLPSNAEYAAGVENNLERVLLSAKDGVWAESVAESVSPTTGLTGFVFKLNAADFPDGYYELRAKGFPSTGVPVVLQGDDVQGDYHSLFLTFNAGGTLPATSIWVSEVGGNDANSGASEEEAVATVHQARERIKTAQAADVGGAFIEMCAGSYKYGEINETIPATAAQRFLTIRPAPGYTRGDVIFDQPQFASSGLRATKVKFEDIVFDGVTLDTSGSAKAWFKNCVYTGAGMLVDVAASLRGSGWSTCWWTEGEYSQARYGPIDFRLVRNPDIHHIGEDVLRATRWVLGGTITDMFRDTQVTWHGDTWSMTPSIGRENVVISELTCDVNIRGHILFADNGSAGVTSMCVRDCSFELAEAGDWGNYVAQWGRPWSSVSFIRTSFGAIAINHRVDLQFTAANSGYASCTGITPINRNVTGLRYLGGTL